MIDIPEKSLVTRLREKFGKPPKSTCRRTNHFVAHAVSDMAQPPEPDWTTWEDHFDKLAALAQKFGSTIQWSKAAGKDEISAARIHSAPRIFFRAVAMFTADGLALCTFTEDMLDGIMNFIPKEGEGPDP